MELHATIRDNKTPTVLRQSGFVPSIVYGKGFDTLSLAVREAEFRKVYAQSGENVLVDLVIDGSKRETKKVLVYDIQKDPLTESFAHIDFYAVRMDEKVEAHVPIVFIGEAPATKEQGGILAKSLDEIQVKAFPQNLPKEFTVDISILHNIQDAIHVRDIKLPEGVEFVTPPDTPIVSIVAQQVEEAAPVTEPALSDIKTEQEEKREEKEKEAETKEEK